jgi:uncharacterized membrane protein YtjA (UPF0391 family)
VKQFISLVQQWHIIYSCYKCNAAQEVPGIAKKYYSLKLFIMLRWTLIFLVIAIIAAIFGFTGIAAGAAAIAKILFYIFIVLFLISLIAGGLRKN